tara:strand:+ start:1489 stop:1740 length:252 start_codon:yes stop_codon:yes gene_type:complete
MIFKDEKHETLTILMEECSEVIQEASKMLRFGNNPTELEREIGDLFAIIQILKEKDYINYEIMLNYAKAKREKLKQWSEIKNL